MGPLAVPRDPDVPVGSAKHAVGGQSHDIRKVFRVPYPTSWFQYYRNPTLVNKASGAESVVGDFMELSSSSQLPDPVEGVAFTNDLGMYVSDYSAAGTPRSKLWWVKDNDPAKSVFRMAFSDNEIILDLASEPDGYCPWLPPPPPQLLGDLGDTPQWTIQWPMTTYGGVSGRFPTLYFLVVGSSRGPLHRNRSDAVLGQSTSHEYEASAGPDEDGVTNIDRYHNVADRDGADDALSTAVALPHCQVTQFDFDATVFGEETDRYVSVWFDYNRDGDWADTLMCEDPVTHQMVEVTERAVWNHSFLGGPGLHTLTTPGFRAYDPIPGGHIWMRIKLTAYEITSPDGRGPIRGYGYGETEDYYLEHAGGSSYAP